MIRNRIPMMLLAAVFTCVGSGMLVAEEATTSPATPVRDPALQKRIDGRVPKLLKPMGLDDPAKTERVAAIVGDYLAAMWTWHSQHDAPLSELWKQWNQARSVKPKDEFPGEVVAEKIDTEYASLKPAYQAFIAKLAIEVTPEQLDAFKENWSRSPGMKRTYDAYLETVLDLTDEDKQVIHARMAMAREDAMLTDAPKEIISIYKRHKVKVEEYVGSLEWAKLHKAFAAKGQAPTTKAATSQPE